MIQNMLLRYAPSEITLCFLASLNIVNWCIMSGTTVSINGLLGSKMDSRDVSVGGLLYGSLTYNFIKRILVLKINYIFGSKQKALKSNTIIGIDAYCQKKRWKTNAELSNELHWVECSWMKIVFNNTMSIFFTADLLANYLAI